MTFTLPFLSSTCYSGIQAPSEAQASAMAALSGARTEAEGGGAGSTPPHCESGALGPSRGGEVNTSGDIGVETGGEWTQSCCPSKYVQGNEASEERTTSVQRMSVRYWRIHFYHFHSTV